MSNTLTFDDFTYERHPLSSVFPQMSPEDFSLLLASMRESRQRVSIKLVGERFVFDGWNRLRACVELGLVPWVEHIAEDQDLRALAVAFNLAHRHLTAGQKGLIAGQLSTMTHGGGRIGAGRPPDEPPIDKGDIDLNNQDLKLDLDSFEPDASRALATPGSAIVGGDQVPSVSNTIKAAAERMGISRATAAMGKRVAENGDAVLLDAVKSGEISLAAGYAIAKSPRDEQRERVKNALANGKEWLKARKQSREHAEKISSSVLKGGALPDDLTEAQITSVFSRVAEAIVVGTRAGATCLEAHAQRFSDAHLTQFMAAHQIFGEALEKRMANAIRSEL